MYVNVTKRKTFEGTDFYEQIMIKTQNEIGTYDDIYTTYKIVDN